MALSNAQLEEILLQKSGKKILLKPKILGSKRLTWEDVLNRLEQGQSIGEGELLPEIPEGISATEFYRYTGISPTLFSREPFSDFSEDIGGATPLDNEPQTIVDNTVDPSIANDARVNRISEDTWSSSDDHDPDDLSPIGYGPVNQDGFMGLLGMVPGVGTLFNLVQQDSPFKVGAAVLGEAFGGKPSGYEAYADLESLTQASKALENGYITNQQFNAYIVNGPGQYYADGETATGSRYERDVTTGMFKDDLDWLELTPGMTGTGFAQDFDPDRSQFSADLLANSVNERTAESLQANAIQAIKDKDQTIFDKIKQAFLGGGEDDRRSGIPSEAIGVLNEFNGDGTDTGRPPSNPADRTYVTADGIYITNGQGHTMLGITTGQNAGPRDTDAAMQAAKNQAKSIVNAYKTTGKASINNLLDPTKGAMLNPTKSAGDYAMANYDYTIENLDDLISEAKEEFKYGYSDLDTSLGPDEKNFVDEITEDDFDPTMEQTTVSPTGSEDINAGKNSSDEDAINAFAKASGDVNDSWFSGIEDFSEPSPSDIESMDPSMGWSDFGGMEAPGPFATPDVAEALQEQFAQDVLDNDTSYKGQTLSEPSAPPASSAPVYSYDDYDNDSGGSGDAVGASDADSDSWGSWDSDDGYMASGGSVKMQDGGEAEMANLGMINEQAAGPQNGGQQSVKDDIPREADAGDYILPYETVLEVGLKQLNRYAKEAIQLAIKNGVNLKGTDLDPSDDVPIKVSNYEYHIPKGLVPYFGGGKKYLDKIRSEGLALRKRLEEEKQPSAQEQQPMEQNAQPTPPQPQMVAEAQPMQPAPQQPPMMQRGGFVLGRNNNNIESEEQVLAQDTSQPAQSAYNQMQAIERSRVQSQQPPMVNPDGKVVQQGFAAPQGYQSGGILSEIQDSDIAQGVEQKTQPPMPDWANRALDPKTPVLEDKETGELQTLQTYTDEINGVFHVYPTIRMVGKELKKYDLDKALSIAMDKKDSIKFKTRVEADSWAQGLTDQIGQLRNLQQPKTPSEPITSPMATVDQQQEPMLPMLDQETGFAEQQQQNVGM